jgi:hypothetical protein
MDSKVGGTYRMLFTNFTTSPPAKPMPSVANTLSSCQTSASATLPGEMITTVTLKPVSVGTELNIVQEGLPAALPLEACYLGWQQSLNHLATLRGTRWHASSVANLLSRANKLAEVL